MYLDNERRPTSPRSSRCAWRSSAASRWWRSRSSSSGSGTSRCSPATSTSPRRNDNRVREIKVQAPRGEIVDRDGARARGQPRRPGGQGHARRDPEDAGERREVYERLGKMLGMKPAAIERARRAQLKALPFSSATVKQDVTAEARVPTCSSARTSSRASTSSSVFLREYPHREIGAHLFGTVGEVTEEQLDDPRYRGVDAGRPRRPVGHRVLSTTASCAAGTAPARVQVDALGNTARRSRRSAPSRAASCACRSTSTCRRRASRRSRAAPARRVRGHEREQRRGARARLAALVRPEHLRQDDPQARLRRASSRGERRAALQPRDPGRLSHGLDVQADHRRRRRSRAA